MTDNNRIRFHLPDFCSGRAALAIVLITELVAIVLTLARQPLRHDFWIDLAYTSLFLLWQSLGSAAILCRLSPWLHRRPARQAYGFTLGVFLAVTVLVAEATLSVGTLLTSDLGQIPDVFPTAHGTFLLRTLTVSFIVSMVALRYFHISAEWRHSVELESQERLRALQARIRPHFLFNSMNTIAALTRTDPSQAETAVQDLADLFRMSLNEVNTLIPIKEEFAITKSYQRIEQLRLGERLQVQWQVDAIPAHALVPSLLLQPLLENAIYHGIEALPAGGQVLINGHCTQGEIELTVHNPLPLEDASRAHKGNKIAADNISQRLALVWPGKAHITTQLDAADYCVTLRFPYQTKLDA